MVVRLLNISLPIEELTIKVENKKLKKSHQSDEVPFLFVIRTAIRLQ